MDQQLNSTDSMEKTSLRKPYEKPAVLETTPLEAVAYICGPEVHGKLVVGMSGCVESQS